MSSFETFPSSLLASHQIEALVSKAHLASPTPLVHGQIQPASLDLRLGEKAWRVRASFLPGPERRVLDCLPHWALHEIDLTRDAVLETHCVYVAQVQESLHLPPSLTASANPKSSTGRLDVFTRVMGDYADVFDTLKAGYCGPLFIEISPRTFPIIARAGSRLSQIRFRTKSQAGNIPILREELLRVELREFPDTNIIGYRAKRHTGVIDVDRGDAYEISDFWDPLLPHPRNILVLDPSEFYILASKESISIPANQAAEMVPFNPLMGEFRVHYAGFFDPGFGLAEAGGAGSRAVLEVRSRDVPFILEDGQAVGHLRYEPLFETPACLYGQELRSHYQAQGLALSKHFKKV